MGKLLVKAIICAVAGVVGWLLVEPSMPGSSRAPDWAGHEKGMVFLCVLLIGMGAGMFSGLQRGSQRHMWMQMGLGAALGAVGGLLGYELGGQLAAGIFGADIFVRGAPMPMVISARMVASAPFGLFLGAAIGGSNLTTRGLMAGAVGGFIGGLASGLLFDVVSSVLAPMIRFTAGREEVGAPGRAALFLLLGFCVGLFTGIADLVTRHAWVRLVLGKNEGREWPLDSQVTTFGRDERALVPLFGDGNVGALHASVVREGGSYVLHDAGTPLGVGLNGARLAHP
ncbi:MAG: FHA domain-containing protein, partial [Armatimonadota bacterium]